jgi:ParB/RepB/Spo0J family partition protein
MSQVKTIPVDKIHISQTNVRANLPFGDSEEDKALIYQINWGKKVVQPFKVRPEKDGYGVYVGRRRFLAKKEAGFKEFAVGVDVIIEDIDEAEASRQSLIENLDFLRKEMDPITRAHGLAQLVDNSTGGLRVVAGQLGIPPTTLSEWLKVLDLSQKMQETVSKGLLSFSDGLQVVRMNLGKETQEKLADVLETQGKEAFEKELERHAESKMKRGLPKGKYLIVRTVFDRVYAPDIELYEKLEKMAEAKHVQIDDYCKNVLKEHVAQSLKS